MIGNSIASAKLTPGQVADRLAIMNVMAAMIHCTDAGDMEGWSTLVTEECLFTINFPDHQVQITKTQFMQAEGRTFELYRERHADPRRGRRMFQAGAPLILRQGSHLAEVAMTVSVFQIQPEGPAPVIEALGNYSGTLVKRGSNWLFHDLTTRFDRRFLLRVGSSEY